MPETTYFCKRSKKGPLTINLFFSQTKLLSEVTEIVTGIPANGAGPKGSVPFVGGSEHTNWDAIPRTQREN